MSCRVRDRLRATALVEAVDVGKDNLNRRHTPAASGRPPTGAMTVPLDSRLYRLTDAYAAAAA